MKLNGTQKFAAPSSQVYDAILNTEVLKSCISGIDSLSYNTPTQIELEATISLPFPGLNDLSFGFEINITNQQAPNLVEFSVEHKGRKGALHLTCQVNLADEADGSMLSYNANAQLEGLVAVVDNPIGQGIAKGKLAEFFKNLEKEVAKARV